MVSMQLFQQKKRYDIFIILLLISLWLIFFWRLFTPIEADQASLTTGDFSGQFVTFGAYQYERFSQGEIPLWNPYNNGGFPFIADTQAAVFYPPRLMTIALANISGTGWNYHALELEMAFHVLFYSFAMFLFLRRLTLAYEVSHVASLTGTLIASYGGYLTGYPPLQLALLEAGVWLPLAALGILEATRNNTIRWLWLIFTGWALGMSWMAGHPQTSWFLTYFLVAYFAYRVYENQNRWRNFIFGTLLFGIVSIGVVAVTLFPGIEYLLHTSRSNLGFDAKSGGFPYRDFIQIFAPDLLTQWSPLFIGVSGLIFASIAVWKQFRHTIFWLAILVISLALSFGADNIIFHSMYNILPGLRYFRGQERAAYLIANSAAVLVSFGVIFLTTGIDRERMITPLRRALTILLGFYAVAVVIAIFFTELQAQFLPSASDIFMFGALITLIWVIVLPNIQSNRTLHWLIPMIVVIELFSVNIDNANFDPVPPQDQLKEPPFIDILKADTNIPFRVDGLRGLTDNFGSYYGIADIQGISPLFLTGVQDVIEFGLPDERAWELFAVRYAYSEWDALVVPWELIGSGKGREGDINLFRLTAPRPYAHLVYDYVVVEDDEASRLLLAEADFDARNIVILQEQPDIRLPEEPPENAGTTITHYEPELTSILVDTPENAILSLAHVDYPGWLATINGNPIEIMRAYSGLSAIEIPAGTHEIVFRFDPTTYKIGAIFSLATWISLGILAFFLLITRVLRQDDAN